MTGCSSDRNGTWTCSLIRDGESWGWIMWDPDRKRSVPPPIEWAVKQVRDLKGGKRKLSRRGTIEIGPAPILLENKGK